MILGRIFALFLTVSILSALITGQGSALAAAVPSGAQAGVTLALSLAGSLCLWSGVGKLMEHCGITALLSRFLRPLLYRLFPSAKTDPELSGALSGNVCANLLGLGNAATPMGIRAAQCLRRGDESNDELCRLIVLNTASIQLIPANVAAIRGSLGSTAPFDILPAVWITSALSAGFGLGAAWLLGKAAQK